MSSPTVRVVANLVWQAKWRLVAFVLLYVLIGTPSFHGFVHEGTSQLNFLWPLFEAVLAWVILRAVSDAAVTKILVVSPLSRKQRARIYWWLSSGTFIFLIHGLLDPLALFTNLLLQHASMSWLPFIVGDWSIHSFASIACLGIAVLTTRWITALLYALLKKSRLQDSWRTAAVITFVLGIGAGLIALFAVFAPKLFAIPALRYSFALLSAIAFLVLYVRPLSLARFLESLDKNTARRIDRATARKLEQMKFPLEIATFKPLPEGVFGWRVALYAVTNAVFKYCVVVTTTSAIVLSISKDPTWFYAIAPLLVAGAGLPIITEYVGSWRTLRVLPISVDRLTLSVFSLFAIPLVASWAVVFVLQAFVPDEARRWSLLILVTGAQFLSVPFAVRFAHRRKVIAMWSTAPMFAFAALIVSLPARMDARINVTIFLAEILIGYFATRRILQRGGVLTRHGMKPRAA